MFPGLISGLFGLGTSLISGVGNLIGSHNNNKQNEKINQSSQDFQERMYNVNNTYNTPSNQKSRIIAAGLNPDLLYGSGLTGSASTAPASPSSIPMENEYSGFSDSLSSVAMSLAAIDKMKAETENIRADTNSKFTFNAFQEQLLQGQIDLNNVSIDVGKSQASLNNAQKLQMYRLCKQIDQNIEQSKSQIDLIRASVRNVNSDTALKRIAQRFSVKRNEVEIKSIMADIGLKGAQATQIYKLLPYVISKTTVEIDKIIADKNLSFDNAQLLRDLSSLYNSQKQTVDFQRSQEMSWQDTERLLNFFSRITQVFGNIINF